MKKLLFILLVFVYSRQINAQTYVLIPDANFRAYLNTIVPSAMSGNSLNITSTLVTTSTQTIDVLNQNISNLNGVQYFTSLTWLRSTFNPLVSLPALPNSLSFIECNTNSLTSLPVLPNSLKYIDCSHNSLTILPALTNSLQSLYCSYNSLTSLPILPNSLITVECGVNSLTALPALPNLLQTLNCEYNSLSSLPTLPNSLQTLSCEYNFLSSLPTLPTSLHALYCNNNNISCFPIFPNSISAPTYNPPFPLMYYININNNPFNCLPNYLPSAMDSITLAYPLCTAGNTNGCQIAPVGIKQFSNDNIILKTYPNPNKGVFKLQLDVDITNGMAVLINALGQNVYECKVVKGINEITATELTKGFYTLILLQNKQPIGRTKVVIE